jgi:hypothetical protein
MPYNALRLLREGVWDVVCAMLEELLEPIIKAPVKFSTMTDCAITFSFEISKKLFTVMYSRLYLALKRI